MTLDFGGQGVALRIADDGRGFEVDRIQLDPDRGIGLRNMRERLASIGGTFEVHAAPGAGTLLLAKVPAEAIRRLGASAGAA
jgi:two-component system NarL family sensor kinase